MWGGLGGFDWSDGIAVWAEKHWRGAHLRRGEATGKLHPVVGISFRRSGLSPPKAANIAGTVSPFSASDFWFIECIGVPAVLCAASADFSHATIKITDRVRFHHLGADTPCALRPSLRIATPRCFRL
jgi:hypothetical protein